MAPGRREQQRQRMRTRLLDAALELFEADGFEATTIDQIADRADVARQTVVNHYPTKREFVRAWGERRRQELSAVEAGAAGTARTRLRRIAATLAEMDQRERDLAVHLREQRIVPEPVPEAIRAVMEDGHRTGELARSCDPQVAAEVVAAVYVDTRYRWLAADPAFDLRRELVTRFEMVLDGLLPRERGGRPDPPRSP